MNPCTKIPRQDFLRYAGVGSASLLTAAVALRSSAQAAPGPRPERSAPNLEIELRPSPTEVSLLSGRPTRVWSYRGKVLAGDPSSLQALPGSYLGPIIRVRRGQSIRVHLINGIEQPTIIHWHGLHVPARMDGHPRYAIGPGQRFVYDFEVTNRAGTYWYHPHPDMLTGPQAYYGMAGLFLVSDNEERALNLPSGEYDVPLVIQDRTFDAGNQLIYLEGAGMIGQMIGFLGDRILVNGHPDFVLPVATRAYRLRLLNGSNSRIYKLAWSDGTPMTIIATDGGLLEHPVRRAYVTLAPAERVELWADFSRHQVGSELVLQSLPFSGTMSTGGMGGMMGGGMMGGGMTGGGFSGGQALPDGAEFPVLTVRVARRETEARTLPARLSTFSRYRLEDAVNRDHPRRFYLAMQAMRWGINGREFQMTAVASDEIVKLGTQEVWELVNDASRAMMGAMAHPIHIHNLQFQVLARESTRDAEEASRTLGGGFLDGGWKDTVLVLPGQRVRLLLKFQDYTGLYLYHCHNLEHEDMGMMRNYLVQR